MTRNLMITGGINHDFEDTALAIGAVLNEVGVDSLIHQDLDTAFDLLADNTFDLITVFTLRWRMLDDDKYIPDRDQWAYEIPVHARQLITAHLTSGRGLLGLHTAAICFDTWDEWASLLGAKWVWGSSFHPPPAEFLVSNINQSHPASQGLENFRVVDEVYHNIAPAAQATPLLATNDTDDHSNQLLAWASEPLGGRSIYSAMAHDRHSVETPGHTQFLQQAARWCSGDAI